MALPTKPYFAVLNDGSEDLYVRVDKGKVTHVVDFDDEDMTATLVEPEVYYLQNNLNVREIKRKAEALNRDLGNFEHASNREYVAVIDGTSTLEELYAARYIRDNQQENLAELKGSKTATFKVDGMTSGSSISADIEVKKNGFVNVVKVGAIPEVVYENGITAKFGKDEPVVKENGWVVLDRTSEEFSIEGIKYDATFSIDADDEIRDAHKRTTGERKFRLELNPAGAGKSLSIEGTLKIDVDGNITDVHCPDRVKLGAITTAAELVEEVVASHGKEMADKVKPNLDVFRGTKKGGKGVLENVEEKAGIDGAGLAFVGSAPLKHTDPNVRYVFEYDVEEGIKVGLVSLRETKTGSINVVDSIVMEPLPVDEFAAEYLKEFEHEKITIDELAADLAKGSKDLGLVREDKQIDYKTKIGPKKDDGFDKDNFLSADGIGGSASRSSRSSSSSRERTRTETPGSGTHVTNNYYTAAAPTPPGAKVTEAQQRLIDAAEERKGAPAARKGLPPALVTTGFGAAVGAIFSAFNKDINPLLATGIGAVCGYFASRFPAVDRLVGDLVHGAQQAPAMATQQAR